MSRRSSDLLRLAKEYGAALVLDEAHATGVGGHTDEGIAAERGCEREVLAIVHTCGKALASAGAFVCGGQRAERISHQSRANIYFQHRDAAVFRGADSSRARAGIGDERNARTPPKSHLRFARRWLSQDSTAVRARHKSCPISRQQ